ncbi:DUF2066 domain-containing protein [Ferrimonas lipolytica]|uniref:DUF2066 domain-containing protein n=1 Tax=Ferrimonas lipolytica TaxID=2724191 RepID=A0A6H1UFD6_9GAMM|nr:DUF2066 domain-containing protein [Ferrimonas lipolytica]QIZ76926.1 DUF2066 domain-containing protein [Ferrimonas lipolytica]
MRAGLLIALCLFSLSSYAVEFADLYRGEVEVNERDNAARNAGVRSALAKVLIRVTGDDALPSSDAGKALIRRADSFMLTYAFQTTVPMTLSVSFDKAKLQQQMRQMGLPIWGAQRPTTIHWLALEQQDGRTILINDAVEQGELVASEAEARGLPQLLPLLDLEDSLKANINDVNGNFPKPVIEASQRYGSDFVLMSSIYPEQGQWHYRINLYSGTVADSDFYIPRSLLHSDGQVASVELAVEALLAEVAKYYADRYASVVSAERQQTQLRFTLTGGVEQLVALRGYLVSLAPVQAAHVVAITGTQVDLELDLVGGLEEVEQLLSLERRISKIEVVDQLQQRDVQYQWSDLD